jgi:hypothetical protein
MLILFLSGAKAFLVTLIVLEFGHHLVFEIGSAHKLVRHLNLVEAALLEQF